MGPPLYMRSAVDRNIVMQHMTACFPQMKTPGRNICMLRYHYLMEFISHRKTSTWTGHILWNITRTQILEVFLKIPHTIWLVPLSSYVHSSHINAETNLYTYLCNCHCMHFRDWTNTANPLMTCTGISSP